MTCTTLYDKHEEVDYDDNNNLYSDFKDHRNTLIEQSGL